MLKVAITGPESAGKTSLTKALANHYKTAYVPEFSRLYLEKHRGKYDEADLLEIAKGQYSWELAYARDAKRILFCDTDLITTQIYSREYLKVVPPVLYEFEKMVAYDLYFLFDIDVPWVSDGVRDLGSEENRKRMYAIFKDELDRRKINYITVQGNWEEREHIVSQAIDLILSNNVDNIW